MPVKLARPRVVLDAVDRLKEKLFKHWTWFVLIPIVVSSSLSALDWNDPFLKNWFWLANDICKFGCLVIGAAYVPYEKPLLKTTLILMSAWRLVVIMINALESDPQYSTLFIGICAVVLAAFVVRILFSRKFVSREPDSEDEAVYYLVPIHSPWGFAKFLLSWGKPGRYETTAIKNGNDIWCVHKNKFVRLKAGFVAPYKSKAVSVPIGRQLLREEIEKLDSMVGKPVKVGVHDCRDLLIVPLPKRNPPR